MRAFVITGVLLLLSGCFYIDPIAPRPEVKIVVVQPDVIYRGSRVTLEADFIDPDTGVVDPDVGPGTYDWKVFACTGYDDRSGATGCDVALYDSAQAERKNTVEFSVPMMTGQALTQAIQARLVARSDRGVVARLRGLSDFHVMDGPPAAPLDGAVRSEAAGAPIDPVAKRGDPGTR